ncbi:cytochrome c [Meiothermus sp. QL-1]|uniref:c-type cytochrome n=1 Tax=Meiothermus sp. QL-1 TaxID=2058095 RepID=UPI000E0BA42A|nr:cytochrome c [Meiothermus sp. QL-1]
MKRLPLLLLALGLLAWVLAQPVGQGRYRIGTPLTPQEVERWNIRPSILPDGRGLPPGEGTVDEGEKVYNAQCLGCHGANGQGGVFNRLVGEPFPVTKDVDPVDFVIGNYWQYPTTLFDYIRRAMPFQAPGTLTDDEVYALVAYLLYQNGIIDGSEPMNAQTLPKVQMPARALLELDPTTQKRFPWIKLP